jgi:hypothetical protein
MMKWITYTLELIWGWGLLILFLIWLWAVVSGGMVGLESTGGYGWEY